MVFFHSAWTLVLFLTFIGIVIWAFSGAQKKSFDAASRMPLEEDEETNQEDRNT